MALSINHRRSGGVEILDLAGPLTLGDGTGLLREAVHRAVERGSDILVNLSGVGYLDSAGLGELVGSYASATAKGRQMKLLRPQRRVESLLQITKLYATFEIFEDEIEALVSFQVPLVGSKN